MEQRVRQILQAWREGNRAGRLADLIVQNVATGIGEVGEQGLLQVAQQDLVGAHLLDQRFPLFLQVCPFMLHHHIQQLLSQPLQDEQHS